MTGENIPRQFLHALRSQMAEDGWYAEHDVTLIVENQADILYTLEKTISGAMGCCIVLKVPRAQNERPAWRLTFEVLAIENPTTNRTKANHATAEDAVWHAAVALDGSDYMLRTIEHTEVEHLFQARATFECVCLSQNPETTEE